MRTLIHLLKPAVIVAGLLLALPMVGMADKGGKPNTNSVPITAACTVDTDTARVCSCKALSNVVLQCGSTYVKYDDIGVDPDTGIETPISEGDFDCGVDSEGNLIDGPITLIAVKSGSQKNAKHHPDGYVIQEDAPSGSGLFFGPSSCDVPVCPISDCEADEVAGDLTEEAQ